jgi:endonuclease/exonuclease/phosphatase family metal-dependent hydrolase
LLRLLTYNVHRCIGVDGRLSPKRIAEAIAFTEPDIVALQELDVGRARTGGVDQAEIIARELGMQMHFHPALRVMEELYGDAILTALPSRLVRAGPLPGMTGWRVLEPRGALWAELEIGGARFQVINTHLGVVPRESAIQMKWLLGPEWLGHPDCRDPLLLAGDLNAVPGTRTYRRISKHLRDVQLCQGMPSPRPTFPVRMPVLRLDHIFVSTSIEVLRTEVVRTPLTRVASDHLPVLVDFKLRAQVRAAATTEGMSIAQAASS